MEKHGEHIPEKDTEAQKEVQKKVYKPIEKSAGITSVSGFFMGKDIDLSNKENK